MFVNERHFTPGSRPTLITFTPSSPGPHLLLHPTIKSQSKSLPTPTPNSLKSFDMPLSRWNDSWTPKGDDSKYARKASRMWLNAWWKVVICEHIHLVVESDAYLRLGDRDLWDPSPQKPNLQSVQCPKWWDPWLAASQYPHKNLEINWRGCYAIWEVIELERCQDGQIVRDWRRNSIPLTYVS